MFLHDETIIILLICRSYPTMLELAVEATYPICEALTVSLISVSASVQGVTIMELDHYLAKPVSYNTTTTNIVSLKHISRLVRLSLLS